jgi:hypothetical protein
MFQSKKPFIFIDFESRSGVSKKTGNEYDINNVKISDGLESFRIDFDKNTVNPNSFSRGEKIEVELSILERFNNLVYVVTGISPAKG